jgi:hypothetical protein
MDMEGRGREPHRVRLDRPGTPSEPVTSFDHPIVATMAGIVYDAFARHRALLRMAPLPLTKATN